MVQRSDSGEFTFFSGTEEYLADKARRAAEAAQPTNVSGAKEFALTPGIEEHLQDMSERGDRPLHSAGRVEISARQIKSALTHDLKFLSAWKTIF